MTSAEIDELEYDTIADLFKYYEDNPPTHVLVQCVAKSLGAIKDKPKSSNGQPTEVSEDQFNELAEAFNFGG